MTSPPLIPTEPILLTGATGMIGHYLLADLLRRGYRCAVLLRPPLADGLERLQGLAAGLGIDVAAHVAAGRVIPLEGDLGDSLPRFGQLPVGCIVHAAGCTRFDMDKDGEPMRTNVRGTEHLLEWAESRSVRNIHLVSTAYVCGAADGRVGECFRDDPPAFHNAYEQSKWLAEQQATAWARRTGGTLTVYRPSIVVGDSREGRATRFVGVYLSVRACEMLSRMVAGEPRSKRHAIDVRMEGRPQARQDIVPVDYVASIIAEIVAQPRHHGSTYHLVHPDPPTTRMIQTAIEQYFDIGGGRFVEPGRFDPGDLSDIERSFHSLMGPLRPYLMDSPVFDRSRIEQVERSTGIECPGWNMESLHRLFRYAQRTRWGRRRPDTVRPDSACAEYFENFLPTRIAASQVAQLAAISTTVRFVIEDVVDGQWVCRFEQGRLTEVHRGCNGLCEDFTYRTREAPFWRIVSGEADPQQVFLNGDAEISGDVEKALKMGMVLRAFNREHPCDRLALESRSGAHDHA